MSEGETPSSKPRAAATPLALDDFLLSLLQHKLLITVVFLVVTSLVAVGAMLTPPQFEAEASLMVKIGREFVYQPEIGSSDAGAGFALDQIVNSEIEILDSRDLAEQVVLELGPERMYPKIFENEDKDRAIAIEQAILSFRDDTTVVGVLSSSVIKVRYMHEQPQLAAQAINLLLDRFKDKHLEVFSDERANFLVDRVRNQEQTLFDTENRLEQFRQEHGVYDLATQKTLLLTRRVALLTSQDEASFEISELSERLNALESLEIDPVASAAADRLRLQRTSAMSQKDSFEGELHATRLAITELEKKQESGMVGVQIEASPTYTTFARRQALEAAHIRLMDLQVSQHELTAGYTTTSRRLTSVKEGIDTVEALIKSLEKDLAAELDNDLAFLHLKEEILVERTDAVQYRIDELETQIRKYGVSEIQAQLAGLRSRQADIAGEIASLEAELQSLDLNQKELRRLERDVSELEISLSTYQTKFEEARVAAELDRLKRINVRVIEKASLPVRPIGMSPKLKTALGGVVGLLGGIAAAFLLELIRPSGRSLA